MNCLRIYNISIDSSRKILVFQTYPSTRPFRHIRAFFYLSFPAFFSYCHSLLSSLIVIPMLFLLSFPGLSGESIKYKAQSYDMYAKSSALQQRFLPQPVMRSSWQQLVMFGLSLIYCHVRACPGHLPRRHPRVYPTSDVIPGFNPGIFRLSLPKPEMAVFFFVILGQAQRVPGISGYSGQARI